MTSSLDRDITVAEIDWQDIRIRISYEADYLGMIASHGAGSAHLRARAIARARAPLPITETAYKSHFCDSATITAAGGPVAFVLAWLDLHAAKPVWREWLVDSRQLPLF